MASKTVVEWVDDIDGGPAAETVTFALDGVEYEIDLSTEHATALRASLKEFIRKARTESAPADDPVEDDEEPGLIPAPTPTESSRHLPAPRSAIKSRISAAQLAMDVEGFDEPDGPPAKTARKAARAPRKAAAEKATEKAVRAPARKIAAKTTVTRPAPIMPVAAQAAPANPAATPSPAPSPTPAPTPSPAPAAERQAEPEPQRPTVVSPFSQPAAPPAAAPAKKDGPARPPMITFSAAKQG